MTRLSSGSSGWVGGAEKHEIYAAAFGGHLFYDLFLQGRGRGMDPSAYSGSAAASLWFIFRFVANFVIALRRFMVAVITYIFQKFRQPSFFKMHKG